MLVSFLWGSLPSVILDQYMKILIIILSVINAFVIIDETCEVRIILVSSSSGFMMMSPKTFHIGFAQA